MVTNYRPPRSYSAIFIDDFAELLSGIDIDYSCYNSGLTSTQTVTWTITPKTLLTLLDTFRLSQHVKEPMCTQDHTLDLITT